jgi:cytoskeletal protein CcmA (bactofilin family)
MRRSEDFRVRSIDEDDIDTVLADDIDFDGELSFQHRLLIKGAFRGEISADGDLYISESAQVDATVRASTVSVKGALTGDVRANRRLELFSSASLTGNVQTPDLIMQSGCRFNGTCKMPEKAG